MCTDRDVNIIFVLTCISLVNRAKDDMHYGFFAVRDWSEMIAVQVRNLFKTELGQQIQNDIL